MARHECSVERNQRTRQPAYPILNSAINAVATEALDGIFLFDARVGVLIRQIACTIRIEKAPPLGGAWCLSELHRYLVAGLSACGLADVEYRGKTKDRRSESDRVCGRAPKLRKGRAREEQRQQRQE
jgi:hypothetical protein